MHPEFAQAVETLHPSFEHLLAMAPIRDREWISVVPEQGVYLFSEGDNHLYVGRSNGIKKRYGRHCNPGATHRMAAFAFQLAREATGRTEVSYQRGSGTRDDLIQDPVFKSAFDGAKARIRNMDFRYVEERDRLRQALLEIYCAIALGTPYNDFGTH